MIFIELQFHMDFIIAEEFQFFDSVAEAVDIMGYH